VHHSGRAAALITPHHPQGAAPGVGAFLRADRGELNAQRRAQLSGALNSRARRHHIDCGLDARTSFSASDAVKGVLRKIAVDAPREIDFPAEGSARYLAISKPNRV